jgi:hypothetical protein
MKSPFAFAGGSIGYSFRYYLSDMVGNTGVRILSEEGQEIIERTGYTGIN